MNETRLEEIIDSICDRFEAAWAMGSRPEIEAELASLDGPGRDELLRHLLALELAYRRRLGEEPDPEEYRRRFTDASTLVDSAFANLTGEKTDATGADTFDLSDEITAILGYEILGELGRGGMGQVLRGRDPELRRDLAVKILLKAHAGRPEMTGRFVDEARISGQLQHPGIVPVYDLGTTLDSRPFFAMKLVRGRTLSDLLAERASPASDLPRFLTIFEQVCQTVAYAHARKVIHRDLKPSNIMVGKFGEVQVMDWGLAKVLGSGRDPLTAPFERADASETTAIEQTVVGSGRSDSDQGRSRTGSKMGTPAYMAPEQARGEGDLVDERSDVFALGSILCKILTGDAAYLGHDSMEILEKAAKPDLADAWARLETCGADAGLIALAKRCLEARPEARFANAGEVASAITAHLEGVQDRLRQAELARVAAQARAEEEVKRRELADELAREASRRATEERRRRRATAGLATAVVAVMALCGGGLAWWQTRMTRADGLLDEAARLCGEAERDPSADLSPTRAALARAEGALGGLGSSGRLARARALDDRANLAARTRVDRLLDEADKRCGEAERDPKGDVTATRAALERASAATGRESSAGHRERLAMLKGRMDKIAEVRTLVRKLESIRGQHDIRMSCEVASADYAKAFRGFGLDLEQIDPASSGALLAKYAMRAEIAAAIDDWIFHISELNRENGLRTRLVEVAHACDPDESRDYFRANMDAADVTELVKIATPPQSASLSSATRVVLAGTLKSAGRDEEAVRVLREGWQRDPGDFWICIELGLLSWDRRTGRFTNPDEALRFLTAAIGIRPDHAVALSQLGLVLVQLGRIGEAEHVLREAVRLNPDIALTHANLGFALFQLDRFGEAETACREAIRLNPNLSDVHSNLGAALMRLNRLGEAEAAYREAIRLDFDNAAAHCNLGFVLLTLSRSGEAETACREAIRLIPDYAEAHRNLGNALVRLGRFGEAETACREAIRLNPKNGQTHAILGVALVRLGRSGEAETACREAIRLNPKNASAYNNLGFVLNGLRRHGEAEMACREAIRLEPNYLSALKNLGASLVQLGRFDEVERVCREIIRLKPDDAEAHDNLGNALNRLGRFGEAEAACREAIRLKSTLPSGHKNLGIALYRLGRFGEAETALREAVRLKPNDAEASDTLALVLVAIRLEAEALRFDRAFPADPFTH